jgi:hypothetical protein
MLPPGEVDEFGIGATAEHLRVAIGELTYELPEGRDFRGAYEGEVLRPEEDYLPLARKIRIRDCLKRFSFFEAHRGLQGKGGEFGANS